MICPKCGRPVTEAAVICSGCDFILDTGFLGEEILDEEKTLRPGRGGVDPAMFNLADAVILGDIDDTAQSFETSDSGFHVRESTGARLYVSGRSQALLAPDAIPAIIQAASSSGVRLTPFERHVLTFIDGSRPVETIRQIAGLDESEVKTALATLADKGVVEVVGRALVELGEDASPRLPRRPQNRGLLRRQIAGAFGPVEDEADAALEEAFRTQTGLSPLNADELAPSGDNGDDDDDVFSSEGSDEGFVSEGETNELESLASSSTPVVAKERRAPTTSFVPVSRTADPPPLSRESDDGFDEFGGASAFGATRRVTLRAVGSSSDLSNLSDLDASDMSAELASPTGKDAAALPPTKDHESVASLTPDDGVQMRASASFDVELASGAEHERVPPRSALSELGDLDDDDIDMPGMGSTAIARIANSALGFPVGRRVGGREARTQASIRIDGDRSRQLLSEAVDASPGEDLFSSLAHAPSLPSEPRPPFLSSSASGIEASGEADDFSGDEYSDEGEATATPLVRTPTALVSVGGRGATDSLLSELAARPDAVDEEEIDTGVVHRRPNANAKGFPKASEVFARPPLGSDPSRAAVRPSTEPSLDLSLRESDSDLLGSSLMRSAAEVDFAGDDPLLKSDAPTGPVSGADFVAPSVDVPSSLVVDDVAFDDPFAGDLSDDDAPTAIRPPGAFLRPLNDAREPEPAGTAKPDQALTSGDRAQRADALPDVAHERPAESDDGLSLDDLLADDEPGSLEEAEAPMPSPTSRPASRRVVAVPERPRTHAAPAAASASSLASQSPAPELSDDDDPALSGLIEGMADLSVLRLAPDRSHEEAFASPPLRRDIASEMGPDTLGVRSDVFTSSPGDAVSPTSGAGHATEPQAMPSAQADSDDASARTQLLRPLSSQRAARRVEHPADAPVGLPRRGLRIGVADSAEHTALRDVPIRDDDAADSHENEGSKRRPSVISSARALALDDDDDDDDDEPRLAEDSERTIGRAREPEPPSLEAQGGDSADEAFDDEMPTGAVEANPAKPSTSMHFDESGMSSIDSLLSEDSEDDAALESEGEEFVEEPSGETEAGGRDSPYSPAMARRQLSSSVELISDDAVVRGRRVDPSSIVAAVQRDVLSEQESEPNVEISALHQGDSGYEGSSESDPGDSFEESTGHYDSAGGAVGSAASEYPLPPSLVEGAPSLDDGAADPEATAYVQHPASHLISSAHENADENASGWSGEGTANVASLTRGESTGIETRGESIQQKKAPAVAGGARRGNSPALSSEESRDPRVAGRKGPAPRGAVGTSRSAIEDEEALSRQGRGRGTSSGDDLRAKARRHFDQALRDQEEGRDSRARMNAKLASVYDPHNEEYRAAVEQWGGEARRPATQSSKPREVELYEEAQRLESEDEIDAAIVLLREGIGINPHIAAFHNRLGVILAVRKHEYAEAAASVRRAVELEPDNLHYKSNYGKIVSKAKMKGHLSGPP